MTISMNSIPSNARVPLVYIEFDNSRAVMGTPGIEHKILVIGQRLATGAVAEGVPTRITSADQAEQAFGRGSMLAEMFAGLKQANRYTESWAIALDEAAAGNAATGTLTITGPATASGTLNLYIGGKRIRVGITSGDDSNTIAAAINAAVNADTSLPVTAGVVAGVVTLTSRWKGETGNDIDLRLNYYQGESTPTGVAVAIVAMTGGSANPDIATAIAAMGDEWWNSIICPYTDAANLTALETELADRWGPTRMIDGIAYSAFKGTHSETGTFGNTRNSNLLSVMGVGASPTPPWIWASVNAAVAASSLSIDPARPLQTLPLTGILPPVVEDRWTMEERNLILYDGIASYTVDSGGRVLIERQITTYQENAYGVADPSYLDVTTPATLSYLRYATRARITQKFPRHKLADDGTRFGRGQAIVTPSVIRAELLALFRELEEKGLVENFDQYKTDLLVERNADDRNRVDVLSSPDLVNQFRVFANQIQFIV
ncbi:MAG: phage tail sheath subtilisin-like domain-containing protein [Candidatus Sedimenticola sp. (ex Thyasira tokunagai)]